MQCTFLATWGGRTAGTVGEVRSALGPRPEQYLDVAFGAVERPIFSRDVAGVDRLAGGKPARPAIRQAGTVGGVGVGIAVAGQGFHLEGDRR